MLNSWHIIMVWSLFFRMVAPVPALFFCGTMLDQESSISVLRNKDHRFTELCAVSPEVIPMNGLDAL